FYTKAVIFDPPDAVAERLRSAGLSVTVHASERLIDVSPAGVTKAGALVPLGITPGSFVALGNDHNDVSLFQAAGVSVCVGHNPVGDQADRRISASTVATFLATLTPEDR
ncbi:MAG: HAD family hydrolase, partial [Mycetocola sp.]